MYGQLLKEKMNVDDVYGDRLILDKLIHLNNEGITTRQIYDILIKEKTEKNESLIPSRNEKKQA